jgi:hypothetical protein
VEGANRLPFSTSMSAEILICAIASMHFDCADYHRHIVDQSGKTVAGQKQIFRQPLVNLHEHGAESTNEHPQFSKRLAVMKAELPVFCQARGALMVSTEETAHDCHVKSCRHRTIRPLRGRQ